MIYASAAASKFYELVRLELTYISFIIYKPQPLYGSKYSKINQEKFFKGYLQ